MVYCTLNNNTFKLFFNRAYVREVNLTISFDILKRAIDLASGGLPTNQKSKTFLRGIWPWCSIGLMHSILLFSLQLAAE